LVVASGGLDGEIVDSHGEPFRTKYSGSRVMIARLVLECPSYGGLHARKRSGLMGRSCPSLMLRVQCRRRAMTVVTVPVNVIRETRDQDDRPDNASDIRHGCRLDQEHPPKQGDDCGKCNCPYPLLLIPPCQGQTLLSPFHSQKDDIVEPQC